jgi:hypothetical protein
LEAYSPRIAIERANPVLISGATLLEDAREALARLDQYLASRQSERQVPG